MTALPNIPRLYTALAECLAVGIYALPLGIRFGKTATIAASAAWALALSAFLAGHGQRSAGVVDPLHARQLWGMTRF